MKRVSYREIRDLIPNRAEFRGNTMCAEWMSPEKAPAWGLLPLTFVNLFMRDREKAREMGVEMYVVYSYYTPIGWAYGKIVRVPEVKYSTTTSRHQGMLYLLR